MGGRGSSGSNRGTSTVNNLLKAGGTRWQKNGNDRVYLKNAISREVDYSDVSNRVRTELRNAVNSAYYDVRSGELVYNKTSYDSYANRQVESAFDRIKRGRGRRNQ